MFFFSVSDRHTKQTIGEGPNVSNRNCGLLQNHAKIACLWFELYIWVVLGHQNFVANPTGSLYFECSLDVFQFCFTIFFINVKPVGVATSITIPNERESKKNQNNGYGNTEVSIYTRLNTNDASEGIFLNKNRRLDASSNWSDYKFISAM